jgi:hypothetical protein
VTPPSPDLTRDSIGPWATVDPQMMSARDAPRLETTVASRLIAPAPNTIRPGQSPNSTGVTLAPVDAQGGVWWRTFDVWCRKQDSNLRPHHYE